MYETNGDFHASKMAHLPTSFAAKPLFIELDANKMVLSRINAVRSAESFARQGLPWNLARPARSHSMPSNCMEKQANYETIYSDVAQISYAWHTVAVGFASESRPLLSLRTSQMRKFFFRGSRRVLFPLSTAQSSR